MKQHKVVLYAQPACGPSMAVKAARKHAGVTYQYVDVTGSMATFNAAVGVTR